MRFATGALAILLLTLAFACTSARPKRKLPAVTQSCSSPFVAARLAEDALVYASPDGNSNIVDSLAAHMAVCADPAMAGFNFRMVMLDDGTTGYVSMRRLE